MRYQFTADVLREIRRKAEERDAWATSVGARQQQIGRRPSHTAHDMGLRGEYAVTSVLGGDLGRLFRVTLRKGADAYVCRTWDGRSVWTNTRGRFASDAMFLAAKPIPADLLVLVWSLDESTVEIVGYVEREFAARVATQLDGHLAKFRVVPWRHFKPIEELIPPRTREYAVRPLGMEVGE